MAAASVNYLAIVLKELGWSYTRLIAELRRHAGAALPRSESMVTPISRWVNNTQQPDDFYRDLLSRATGRARGGSLSLPWLPPRVVPMIEAAGTTRPAGRIVLVPQVRCAARVAPAVLDGACGGRSQIDTRVGCIDSSTIVTSSPVNVSRSISWRSRSLNPSIVRAAS